MTEDRAPYGNPICACSFRSQGHKPDGCEEFAVADVWMWEPGRNWRYVSLCGTCREACGHLSDDEYDSVSRGMGLPRENGWDINEPATHLRRSPSGVG